MSTVGMAGAFVTLCALFLNALAMPSSTFDLAQLYQGRWALVFVVLPGCPACERVLAWLGEGSLPAVNLLLVAPWASEELEVWARTLGVPWWVDEGGRMGASLGVQRAPSVVLFLDGRPWRLLPWPLGQGDLVRGLAELAAAPREGPHALLGSTFPLERLGRLLGEQVDLQVPRPILFLFFNPECPPCWEALAELRKLSEGSSVQVVVVATRVLSSEDRKKLAESGFVVVGDEGGELARAFGVRATPTYVILDGKGVIRWVGEGLVRSVVLEEAILAIVSEGKTGEQK